MPKNNGAQLRAIKLGPQARVAQLVRMENSEETRSVELTFSSEEPYERYWGVEILGHAAGEVDLSWLETGHAPLLVDHNTRDQVGIVQEATIGADAKGRAVVRFGKSARAEEIFRDVMDGIRTNVSVGYQINRLQLIEERDDVSTYRVTSWKPLEVSLVSIPADETVGVGRDREPRDVEIIIERGKEMELKETEANDVRQRVETAKADAARDANARASDIIALGLRFGLVEDAQKAIADGMPADQFRKLVLEKQEANLRDAGTPETEIGMTEREVGEYSVLRAINAAARNDWSKAGLERDASEAIAKKLGTEARSFFVPYDVLKREMTVGTADSGGNLVGTTHLAGSFIDLLRNRMMVTRLGAQMLSGLVGDVDIPSQTGGATSYWLGEGDDVTGSDLGTGSVVLSPKTVAGKLSMTRRLLKQSSPDVEMLVRNDLINCLALAIDLAAINGSGSSNQPTGILNMTGIGAVVGGTNGAAPTWAHIVGLETEVSVDNADVGSLAYLTNSKVRGKLKQTEKASGTAQFVFTDGQEPGVGMMNGYAAAVSNQVPSTLTKGSATGVCSAILYGNWSDLLIGEWGVLDLQVDPYTSGDSGGTIVRAFQDVDIAARHVESFSAMKDALTT